MSTQFEVVVQSFVDRINAGKMKVEQVPEKYKVAVEEVLNGSN